MKTFQEWVLNEEIFPNKTATVFHRTSDPSNIEKMLHYGVDANAGVYGEGLYSTFALESQFKPYMERYGKYIVKFKVKNLQNFLITPLNVAKHVLGDKYKISDQFKKNAKRLFGSDEIPREAARLLPEADKMQLEKKYSGDLAIYLLKELEDVKKFSGAVYWVRDDGYCLVKYEPVGDGFVMLGYSVADANDRSKYEELSSNKGWETTAAGGGIRHLYGTGKKEIKVGDEVYLSDARLVTGEKLKNILLKGNKVSDFLNRILRVVSVGGGNAEVEMQSWELDDNGHFPNIRAVFPLESLALKNSSYVSPKYKLQTANP